MGQFSPRTRPDGEIKVSDRLGRRRHDATTLIESFRNDWSRIAAARSSEERADIHAHMRHCLEELTALVRELEADNG
jgi:hypothetical protein